LLIGDWDEKKQQYCNDWVVERVVQKAGRGVAEARAAESRSEEEEAEQFAQRLSEGQWVAIDCDRDPEGFGFWLAKAAGPSYVAQREYKNGEVHHKLGEHLVDVDYYARLDPSKPLDFEHEALKETVKSQGNAAAACWAAGSGDIWLRGPERKAFPCELGVHNGEVRAGEWEGHREAQNRRRHLVDVAYI
jgi:hypothetical protein